MELEPLVSIHSVNTIFIRLSGLFLPVPLLVRSGQLTEHMTTRSQLLIFTWQEEMSKRFTVTVALLT